MFNYLNAHTYTIYTYTKHLYNDDKLRYTLAAGAPAESLHSFLTKLCFCMHRLGELCAKALRSNVKFMRFIVKKFVLTLHFVVLSVFSATALHIFFSPASVAQCCLSVRGQE